MSTSCLETAPIEAKPYVRSVEVVALDTLAQLLGREYQRHTFDQPAFNIYRRCFNAHAETAGVLRGAPVDLVPHPCWKVCGLNRYWVEELGHSERGALKDIEHWPDWQGRWDLRFGRALSRPASEDNDPFVLLGGDTNHYHWVLNFVPRLLLIEEAARTDPRLRDARLLVPDALSDNALALLQAMGVARSRILRVGSGEVLRFQNLIMPSLFPHHEFSPRVFAWYAAKVVHRRKGPPKRRVLISRGELGAIRQRRCVINEADVLQALAPLGFEAHNLGQLAIEDQIDLFSDAQFVIGPHGAGFANMVFCQPGTGAVVLENSWNHTFMCDMINVQGGRAEVLVCDDVIDAQLEARHADDPALAAELRRNRDMRVNIPALVDLTHRLLAGL